MSASLEIHVVTPKETPLAPFGPEASREVARLVKEAGVVLHIAARAGANLEPQPFQPVIHGVLMTERSASLMRSEPGHESRIAGLAARELAGYIESVDEAHGHVRGLPVDLKVGRSGRSSASTEAISRQGSAPAAR